MNEGVESIQQLIERCGNLRAESAKLSQQLGELAHEILRMQHAKKLLDQQRQETPRDHLSKLPRVD